VSEHYNKRPKCINPCLGLKNIIGFYLDFDTVESEFQKEFLRTDEREKNMLFNVSDDDDLSEKKIKRKYT